MCSIPVQILATLGTESSHRSAAQCVAYISAAEIPTNQWPELIPTLLANVTNNPTPPTPEATENLKEASLEAIGYICEELVSMCLCGVMELVSVCVCLCEMFVRKVYFLKLLRWCAQLTYSDRGNGFSQIHFTVSLLLAQFHAFH